MDLEEQYDKLYRYCYFKLYNIQLAQDITQEAFLRYFQQKSKLDSKKELPYLYTIARNLCIDYYRKKSALCWNNLETGEGYDPTEHWISDLDLRRAIMKLSSEERELILLRYSNEISISEISKITGLSRFAIYRRLSRILKRLKEEMEREDI